jgi:hypothetical protein
MPVFILMFNVKPESHNPQAEEIAGAYVNCFVLSETFERAEEKALKFLRQENWVPITLEETCLVTEADYKNDRHGLEVYQQVLIDGEKYTVHTYVTEDD